MIKVLITGAGSYVGESVRNYILLTSNDFEIDVVDTLDSSTDSVTRSKRFTQYWKEVDFSRYDVVFHVAGIAHVNAKSKMESLYYMVNRDLTIDVAKRAKDAGVKQFIFMSSQIVFHESKSLKGEMLTKNTLPAPNGFYGDSKLQAEEGLKALCGLATGYSTLTENTMKLCILRPCMIYGPNAKGNFPRLAKLATKVFAFPKWHNKRSMLYIDNLAEFVKQAIIRQLDGTFYPQNRELADTVEIVSYFAKVAKHKVWFTKLLNPCVWMGSFVLQSLNKMFASYYYDPEMSKMDFEYQIVSFEESLRRVAESFKP